MNDLQLIGTVLGAASFGVVITLVAQLVAALRAQSREMAEASRRVAEVAELLKPSAVRVQRIFALLDESEPDLHKVQDALHRFSKGSVQLADNFARVSGWVGLAAPLLMAAFEGWAGRSSAAAPEPGSAPPPPDAVAARDDDGEDDGGEDASRMAQHPAAPPRTAPVGATIAEA